MSADPSASARSSSQTQRSGQIVGKRKVNCKKIRQAQPWRNGDGDEIWIFLTARMILVPYTHGVHGGRKTAVCQLIGCTETLGAVGTYGRDDLTGFTALAAFRERRFFGLPDVITRHDRPA